MSFLTLFKGDSGWLATDQRVFSTDEVGELYSAIEASEQLSKLVSKRTEADKIAFEQGRVEGFKAGEKTAMDAGKTRTAAQLLRLTQEQQQATQSLRDSTVPLAVEIVRRIAGDIEPAKWLTEQAGIAAAELVDAGDVTLKVHISQVEGVEHMLQAQGQTIIKNVCGVDDVLPGFCQLETPVGNIDVDLDIQLERIGELLASPALAGSD